MVFSIIIINYKQPEMTGRCLESLFEFCCKKETEVIVVDNGSSDGSINFLNKRFGDKIKIVQAENNLGFSKANNLGASFAKGRYLFFLNNDTIIIEDVFFAIEKIFEMPKTGIVAPILLQKNSSEQEYSFGSFSTPLGLVLRRTNKKISKVDSIDWVSGAALAIRKDLFLKLGGFDESFFMYYEDMDLCRRVKDEGFLVKRLQKGSLIHLGGQSLGDDVKRKKYYDRSQDIFISKYFGQSVLIIIRPLRAIYRFLFK